MPVEIQTPGPAQQLTGEFAVKGGLKLLLDEVVVPTRAIKDRPRKFVMGEVTVAAAAGFRSEIALTNQFTAELGRDATLQLHKIWLRAGTGPILLAWPTVAVVGLTVIPTMRFLNNSRSGTPQASFGQDNTAAATAAETFGRFFIDSNGPSKEIKFDPSPIIIEPVAPRTLLIRPDSDNLALSVTLLWSEPPDPA